MTAIPGAIQNLRIPQPHHVPADSLQSPPPFTTPVAEPLTPSIKHSYMEEDPSTGQSYREATRAAKRKARRKNETIIASLCQLIVQHQIGLAANLLLLHGMTHACFPRARRHTRKFFLLSYYNQDSGRYALGWDDANMVVYWIILFTGLRAAVLDYVLVPLAQLAGIDKKKGRARFAEQAWILIYDTVFWCMGMYLMYNSQYWLNLHQLWTGWPDREMDGLFKWYYLVQFAFWLQQIFVVNIEERRKDHWQMFTHHIITCALMFMSYGYHQTRVGNMILCLMDVVDILFALAKILKYLQFRTACDFAFGAFMVVWVGARHVLYLTVCYSIYAHIPEEITYGCYWGSNKELRGPMEVPGGFNHLLQPFRDPRGLVCWDNSIKWTFLGTLLALQVILLIWFGMIIRVALKVIRGGEAEDSRSDDEGSDEEEEEEGMEEGGGDSQFQKKRQLMKKQAIDVPPLEEEVGVEAINLSPQRMSPSRKFRKASSHSSGVHLPSDRKELLGRIGCDKGA